LALSVLILAPTLARAQLVGLATAESQYSLRGVGLSNGKPDVRLGFSYDNMIGAYGGASLIVGDTADAGVKPLGYITYVGYARPALGAMGWDVGLTNTQIYIYLPAQAVTASAEGTTYTHAYTRKYAENYSEAYGGVTSGNLSAHLYLSPNYLGQDFSAAYAEISAAARPMNQVRLYGHVGLLTPLSQMTGNVADRERYDVALGVAREFRHGEIQLTWTGTTPHVVYPLGYRQNGKLVLSLISYF
jgi:hypothetical protein